MEKRCCPWNACQGESGRTSRRSRSNDDGKMGTSGGWQLYIMRSFDRMGLAQLLSLKDSDVHGKMNADRMEAIIFALHEKTKHVERRHGLSKRCHLRTREEGIITRAAQETLDAILQTLLDLGRERVSRDIVAPSAASKEHRKGTYGGSARPGTTLWLHTN